MIRFSCPGCDAEIEVPDSKAGAKAKCGDCGERLDIPSPGKKTTSPLAAGRPVAKAPPPKRRPAEDDDDADEKAPRSPAKRRPADEPEERASRPATRRSRRDDDDDEAPKKKSGRAGSKRQRDDDDEDEPKSSKKLLFVGGGLVAACAIAIAAFVLLQPKAAEPPKAADNTPPSQPAFNNPNPLPSVDGKAVEVKEDQNTEKEKKHLVRGGVATKNDIYRHVLQSSVWIVNVIDEQKAATGTGTLVDKKNRLVLTNLHVVDHNRVLLAVFPIKEGDKVVVERDKYMKKVQARTLDVIPCKVLGTDNKKDLALIQLEKLPNDVLPLGVSDKSSSPGDDILSVGNPGSSDSLWAATTGTVRQVGHKTYKSGGAGTIYDLDMEVVETQSPVNPGDSGGPMVNTNGQLVGVTQGFNPAARLSSIFIDVSEARSFIENTCKTNTLTWERSDRKVEAYAQGDVTELVKELESSDAKARAQAAQSLAEMGPAAQPAVAALVKLLKDSDILCRTMAQKALDKIGAPDKSALIPLTEALKDSVLAVKVYAGEALGKIGPGARMAGPALIAAMKDEDALVRQHVARSLGKIGFDDKEKLIAVLTPALDDTDKGVRVAAAETLTMGTLGSADIPAMEKLLKHRDMEVRVCAAHGLGKLGTQAKKAIPALVEAFKSSTGKEARRAIVEVLALFGANAKSALPVFIDAMGELDLQPVASLALSKLGADAKPALKVLTDGLAVPNKDTKNNCLVALAKLGAEAKEAVPAIASLLEDKERPSRLQVLAALGQIGPGAVEAIPELVKVMGETFQTVKDGNIFEGYDKDMLTKVTDVLAKIGKDAVTPLLPKLEDTNKVLRLGAIIAMGKIGPDAKRAARVLLVLAQRDPFNLARDAAENSYRLVMAKKIVKPKTKPKPMVKDKEKPKK